MPGLRVECTPEEFEQFWPRWRQNENGDNLLDCIVHCSVDRLCKLVFHSGSVFQEDFREARGQSSVCESAWMTDYGQLPSLPGGYNWATQKNTEVHKESKPELGKIRKVHFKCKGLAFYREPYNVEECQRCVKYIPNKLAIFEVAVVSTPPYCDRFRPVQQYKIEALDASSCKFAVDYQIIYIQNVNFMIRSLVEKSAKSGMMQNFEEMVKSLEKRVPLENLRKATPKSEHEVTPPATGEEIKAYRIPDLPCELIEDAEEALLGFGKGIFLPGGVFSLIFMILAFPFRFVFSIMGTSGSPRRDPCESLVLWLVSAMLTCTLAFVIYRELVGMRDECNTGSCRAVFELIDLPSSFNGFLISGLMMLAVSKCVRCVLMLG